MSPFLFFNENILYFRVMNYRPVKKSLGLRLGQGCLEIYQKLTDITLPVRALLMIDDFVTPLNYIYWNIESLSHLFPTKKKKKNDMRSSLR